MGFACRTFLVAQDERLGRLAIAAFDRMLRNPASHRLPQFAGQRVRMASIIVELDRAQPVRVVRRTFAVLSFDNDGGLDLGRFGRQQAALAETELAPALGGSGDAGKLLEAASRFVAQRGTWTPSGDLARAIDRAAMGGDPSRRLKAEGRHSVTAIRTASTGRSADPARFCAFKTNGHGPWMIFSMR